MIQGKEKAEKSSLNQKKKVKSLADMVRDLRGRTQTAKKMQSKAERKAKESVTTTKRLHEKEMEMLVADHESEIIANNKKHKNNLNNEIAVKDKELNVRVDSLCD